ncbi:MAG: HAMP domain-containing sensor histidine kinase [Bacteroidales bacterium]|nr:HAMP domain-containing sensor histidine kinase [Bacteroidales bacterium]
MKLFKLMLLSGIVLLSNLNISAMPRQGEGLRIMRTLEGRLAEATTPKDSILLLENIFDLSQSYRTTASDSLAELTYHVARRAGDDATALDMLRQRANYYSRYDSVLNSLRGLALELPESDDRSATVTFIDIMLNSYYARNLDEPERSQRLHDELERITVNPPEDIYDRITLLHSICVNISHSVKGELLIRYIEKLGELIDRLPADNLALSNTFYVQSAIIYTEAGLSEKAIAADHRLLDIMDSLEQHYSRIGRPYRDYDANRYIAYTRLLSNWENLPQDSVQSYYDNAMTYLSRSSRATVSNSISPRPQIYYAMATQDYSKAMPLIKGCIDYPANKPYKRKLLKYLIECADALGDKETVLKASQEYIAMLELLIDRRIEDSYKEIQIIYDVYDMKKQMAQLEAEHNSSRFNNQRLIIIISVCSILLLAGLLIISMRLYRKARKLTTTLVDSNKALALESANLRQSQAELTKARDQAQRTNDFKTNFIKNMSREVSIPLKAVTEYTHLIVDCSESEGKPYLERYAELVELNCGLLNSIVNDVLHLSEIDSDTVSLNSSLFDLYKTASLSVDTIARRIGNGVDVSFDTASPRLQIYSDQRRVQQIINNLLNNAAKFTTNGKITLSYDLSNDRRMVVISVSDTGIGIPADQAERIFDRFVKLDKEAQGVGLGLTISRMLARLLGGDLTLDTTYKHGARFVLTLPYKDGRS